MSVYYSAAAWDADLEVTAKLVLLALADWANDEGLCWPSVAALVARAGVSDRTVQRTLRGLAEDGYIVAEGVGGRGKTNHYRITSRVRPPRSAVGKGDTGDRERVTPVTERVTPVTPKGDTAVSPGSVKDPSKDPSKDPVVRAAPACALTEPVLAAIRGEYGERLQDCEGDIAYWLNHIGFQTARDKPAFLRRKLEASLQRNAARASPAKPGIPDEYDIDAYLAREEAGTCRR